VSERVPADELPVPSALPERPLWAAFPLSGMSIDRPSSFSSATADGRAIVAAFAGERP